MTPLGADPFFFLSTPAEDYEEQMITEYMNE